MNKLLRLLCPSEFVESVPLVEIAELKHQRIRAVLVDLDNTLVPWRSCDIAPGVKDWMEEAERQEIKICIVSNTRTERRLRNIAVELGIPFVRKGLKPRRRSFFEALKLLDIKPNEAAVIGDQIFTDILGGNRLGLYTILVRPLHKREFIGTRVSRLLERVILSLLEQKGMLRRINNKFGTSGNNRSEPTV